MKVIDIKAVSKITKKHNLILAVDNTFLTSYLQKPIELGADLSIYSLTKYMNGHSDVIMGAIMTNNRELHEKLQFLQNGNLKIKIRLYLFSIYTFSNGHRSFTVRLFASQSQLKNTPLKNETAQFKWFSGSKIPRKSP